MANEENLIPNSRRTPEERRENARKAGKKSGEVRRRKKLLRDCMLDLLALPVTNTKEWNKLAKIGIDVEDIDNRALLTAALFRKAVEQGDVAAFKEIRNLIGEEAEHESGENETGGKGILILPEVQKDESDNMATAAETDAVYGQV